MTASAPKGCLLGFTQGTLMRLLFLAVFATALPFWLGAKAVGIPEPVGLGVWLVLLVGYLWWWAKYRSPEAREAAARPPYVPPGPPIPAIPAVRPIVGAPTVLVPTAVANDLATGLPAGLPAHPARGSRADAPVERGYLADRDKWRDKTDRQPGRLAVYGEWLRECHAEPWPDDIGPAAAVEPLGIWRFGRTKRVGKDKFESAHWIVQLWLATDYLLQVGPDGLGCAWRRDRIVPRPEGEFAQLSTFYPGAPEAVNFYPLERWQDTEAIRRRLPARSPAAPWSS